VSAYDDQLLNRLAQYLYEEIGLAPHIQLQMPMTRKPELVAALKRAIERVQEQQRREFEESLAKITAAWSQMTEGIAQAFADAAKATRKAEYWDVEYFHEDCPHCEACAEEAIKNAKERGTPSEVYNEMVPAAVTGWPTVGHSATVTRKDA
jgi:hypothetical protein